MESIVFGATLSDRVTYFIRVLQQFQTSTVRHQAHTDQNIENIESGQMSKIGK